MAACVCVKFKWDRGRYIAKMAEWRGSLREAERRNQGKERGQEEKKTAFGADDTHFLFRLS